KRNTMLKIKLVRYSNLERDVIFDISTDIERFSKLLPKYFKSLQITKSSNSEYLVTEKISFLGKILETQTKHVVKKPDIHEIHLLTGPLRNSSFLELYEISDKGTKVTIEVNLQFKGVFRLFSIFGFFIKKQVNKILDEFLLACENKKMNHV
ncbi:MAG TPA: SRPBCC family protein, partial [Nitrosopumilaceae archaeon]|nr:SRPBCC family protein [Nitrosopumilaceae archaeon]